MPRVDFLIVTALKTEYEAVAARLEDTIVQDGYTVGKVDRAAGGPPFRVALALCGEGVVEAERATTIAITRFVPARVILCGIAAGFPESGVGLGDVLVPGAIVDYEHAKITFGPAGLEVEHRGHPVSVSYPLLHCAMNLAQGWAPSARVQRPADGLVRVHADPQTILGCGMKVVSAKPAEARSWLLAEFKKDAIGLEMESVGVVAACQATDTKYLVIKGVQDDATEAKDDPAAKDAWRSYAADVAADFTVFLISHLSLQSSVLLVEHARTLHEVVEHPEYLPEPYFDYRVNLAAQYGDLLAGHFDSTGADARAVLVPNDYYPTFALHAAGGQGKSRIARELLAVLMEAQPDSCPILLDLRRLESLPDATANAREHQNAIFAQCSAPRRTVEEVRTLLQGGTRVVLLLDALNEVPKETRDALLLLVREYRDEGTCQVVATDRMAERPTLEGSSVVYATIDRLNDATLTNVLGAVEFNRLDDPEREILRHPFFLSLNVRKGFVPHGPTLAGNFRAFFERHFRWDEGTIRAIGSAVVRCLDRTGRLQSGCLEGEIPTEHEVLVRNEILRRDSGQFDHDLWRDFFTSCALAEDQTLWDRRGFDNVTVGASSFEPLLMALEALAGIEWKVEFVKHVYDWNWLAACLCVASQQRLPDSLVLAVEAAIAEKLFDPIQHTKERSRRLLESAGDSLSAKLLEAENRHDLVLRVLSASPDGEWFEEWCRLYCKPDGCELEDRDVVAISAGDPLVGWAAANLARRATITPDQLDSIHGQYELATDSETIRWRVVHAASHDSTPSNVAFLLHVLETEGNHWVQYGAVRAVVEVASLVPNRDDRVEILRQLTLLLARYDPPERWMRKSTLTEVVEAARVDAEPNGWHEDLMELLEAVVRLADDEYREALRSNVERLLAELSASFIHDLLDALERLLMNWMRHLLAGPHPPGQIVV